MLQIKNLMTLLNIYVKIIHGIYIKKNGGISVLKYMKTDPKIDKIISKHHVNDDTSPLQTLVSNKISNYIKSLEDEIKDLKSQLEPVRGIVNK